LCFDLYILLLTYIIPNTMEMTHLKIKKNPSTGFTVNYAQGWRVKFKLLYALHCGRAARRTKASNVQGTEGRKLQGVQQRRAKYLR